MSQYRVTMQELKPFNIDWPTFTVTMKAVSAKHAMKKATAIYHTGNHKSVAIKARRYNAGHKYWRKLWARAYDNMPTRTRVRINRNWVPQEPSVTPVPEYIKGVAKGTIRHVDGDIYKLFIKKKHYRAGQLPMLSKLLGYSRTNHGGHDMAHLTVAKNIAVGARPREEWRRKLLIELAGKDGTKLALELSGQRFEPVKLRKQP